jgi:hypothetical protein
MPATPSFRATANHRLTPYPVPDGYNSIMHRIAVLESVVLGISRSDDQMLPWEVNTRRKNYSRGSPDLPEIAQGISIPPGPPPSASSNEYPLWGGEDLPTTQNNIRTSASRMSDRQVVDKTAQPHSPLHWLTAAEVTSIKDHKSAPLTKPELYTLYRDAQNQNNYYGVFLAKHIVAIIKRLGQDANEDQKYYLAQWRLPAWFANITRAHEPSAKPVGKTIPTPSSPLDAWEAHYIANPIFRVRGVSRLDNGKPVPQLLNGRNTLLLLIPRAYTKTEERRSTNNPLRMTATFFAEAQSYPNKLAELEITIAPVWAPKRFASAVNMTIDDFIRHAADCGLSVSSAEGPVRDFAQAWLADEKPTVPAEISANAPAPANGPAAATTSATPASTSAPAMAAEPSK